jgi:hypothetical protein
MGKFLIKKKPNKEYQFALLADNGQIILVSKGYTSKTACESGIISVQVNAQDETHFERRTSSNGKYYFHLKDINGHIIGTSEPYASEAGRENGISSVKRNSTTSIVETP